MPNSNRKLLVASEKLFISNSLLRQFAKDHDILSFNYNHSMDLESNARAIWGKIKLNLDKDYEKIVFIAHGVDCNVLYYLYRDRNLNFDAAVFVDYDTPDTLGVTPRYTNALKQSKVKIYSFATMAKKITPPEAVQSHQSLPWYYTTRSSRLAQEIFGCVVYDAYQENYLSGTNSKFI